MAAAPPSLLLCQRIGCSARYEEGDNREGACRHHPSPPSFHDGVKSWPCCGKRSHDFGEFLSLPGCAVGRHTQEKPAKAAPPPVAAAAAPQPVAPKPPAAADCPRCRAGFYCTAHPAAAAAAAAAPSAAAPPPPPPPPPDAEQTCRNAGCGSRFREVDNHAAACAHHPGPPVFHERRRGWRCCDKMADDFDDFLRIPVCATGRHNANPVAQGYAKSSK